MEKLTKKFSDQVDYNSKDKTAISVRDGVLEYLGSELGIEPIDKVFTVYRSPATISNVAMAMNGIPLVDEHVSLDAECREKNNYVKNAMMIDVLDEATQTSIAIKNILAIDENTEKKLLDKRQLSLGYFADLVEHKTCDFEQVDIRPHHLAIVSSGRCGELCSFLDKKLIKDKVCKMKFHKSFVDEENQVSIEQVVEIALALPDVIKKLSLDDLKKIMPTLQDIVAMAQSELNDPVNEPEPSTETSPTPTESVEPKDEDMGKKDDEKGNSEKSDDETEGDKKSNFSDKKFNDAVSEKAKTFVDAAIAEYSATVDKARLFLDDSYNFAGKTSKEIMVAALETESTDKFTNEELPTAFKLLKRTADYKSFGDNNGLQSKLAEVGNKEL